MKNQVCWLMDYEWLDKQSLLKIPKIISELGHISVEKYCYPSENDCVVLYGPISHYRKVIKTGLKYLPGALGIGENIKYSIYTANIPREIMFNQDFVITTWVDFCRRKSFWYQIFSTDKIFIRPDSGYKTFTGQVIDKEDFDYEINSMNQITGIMPEHLIIIASFQEIILETRFVIADNKVVSYTTYFWNSDEITSIIVPDECKKLALIVAEQEWQADIAYTCDIVIGKNGPKVLELNSFSCAGLYSCDLIETFRQVSEISLKEFNGE